MAVKVPLPAGAAAEPAASIAAISCPATTQCGAALGAGLVATAPGWGDATQAERDLAHACGQLRVAAAVVRTAAECEPVLVWEGELLRAVPVGVTTSQCRMSSSAKPHHPRSQATRAYISSRTCAGWRRGSPSGRLRGDQRPAVAKLLPDSEIGDAERLIKRKYRADLLVIAPLRSIQSALHLGRPRTAPVILSITPRP
jgi:hypothetical protein